MIAHSLTQFIPGDDLMSVYPNATNEVELLQGLFTRCFLKNMDY